MKHGIWNLTLLSLGENFRRFSLWCSSTLASVFHPILVLIGWQITPKASFMLAYVGLVRLLVEVLSLGNTMGNSGIHTLFQTYLPSSWWPGIFWGELCQRDLPKSFAKDWTPLPHKQHRVETQLEVQARSHEGTPEKLSQTAPWPCWCGRSATGWLFHSDLFEREGAPWFLQERCWMSWSMADCKKELQGHQQPRCHPKGDWESQAGPKAEKFAGMGAAAPDWKSCRQLHPRWPSGRWAPRCNLPPKHSFLSMWSSLWIVSPIWFSESLFCAFALDIKFDTASNQTNLWSLSRGAVQAICLGTCMLWLSQIVCDHFQNLGSLFQICVCFKVLNP